MSEERETRLFMISPRSMLTPDQLSRMVHSYGEAAIIKETCYGCLVEAPRETVLRILAKVREKYPHEVFSKVRAYPCSDPRRCRAQHGTTISRRFARCSDEGLHRSAEQPGAVRSG